jgi:Flp pilus assembly protein TadD
LPEPDVAPGFFAVALATIAAGALGLRLVHLAALNDTPLFSVLLGDSREYDRWAQEIAGGAWIGSGVFYQAPLFPYVLAIVYSLAGHDVAIVRTLQAIAGAVSCVLLGLAGRRFFNAAAGLIGAGLLAVYPAAIFFDGLVQKSSLDLLLITSLLASLGAFVARSRTVWLAVAGATLGAFILNRENAAVLYPVLAVWIWMYSRPRPRTTRTARIGVFTAAIAVVLLPVGIRNQIAGGEFVLTTSQLGTNFYIGNHANAGGSYESLIEGRGDAAYERADATGLAEQAVGRSLSPREVSRYWVGRAWSDIHADPWRWLRLLGRKLLLTLNAAEPVDTESIDAHAEHSLVLRLTGWLDFGVILPLGVLGAWLTRESWRRHAVLYAMFTALVVSVAAFYVLARYRLPLVPIVLLFAGAGVSVAGRAGVRRAEVRRALRTSLVVTAAAAIVANLPLPLASHDDTYLNVATELVRANRPAESLPLFERAITGSPSHALAYYEYGWALKQLGERRQAIEAFRRTVALRPDHAEARMALAGLLLESGDPPAALEHASEAVRLRPGDFAMRVNLANVLFGLKRTGEAIAHYEAAVRTVPDSAEDAISVLSLLAEAYRESGRRAEAIATLEKALAVARAAKLEDVSLQLEQTIQRWR